MMLNGDVESKVQHLDAMQWCVELDESGERSWIGSTVLNSAMRDP